MATNIFIITGEQGSGKTTFLKQLIDQLKQNKLCVGGIVAEGFWKDGQRERFNLVDQLSGDSIVYCQREQKKGWEKIRHFYINPKGQSFGEQALSIDKLKISDVIAIDEIGPFELQGKGWAVSLKRIMKHHKLTVILIVRELLLDEIISYFQLENPIIIEHRDYDAKLLSDMMMDPPKQA